MRADGVSTTDPTFDEWIRPAQVAARLGEWEIVLRYYFRSFVRYHTIGTPLFSSSAYRHWVMTHEGVCQAIHEEEKADARSHPAG